MESVEKMIGSFGVPADCTRKGAGTVANFATSLAKRKLNFLSKNAKGVCDELKKSIDSEATPLRVERQIKRLNDFESDCVCSIGELLADVEQDDLIK